MVIWVFLHSVCSYIVIVMLSIHMLWTYDMCVLQNPCDVEECGWNNAPLSNANFELALCRSCASKSWVYVFSSYSLSNTLLMSNAMMIINAGGCFSWDLFQPLYYFLYIICNLYIIIAPDFNSLFVRSD